MPDPRRMSTDFGREIAGHGSIERFIRSTRDARSSGGNDRFGSIAQNRPPRASRERAQSDSRDDPADGAPAA
jgi:hypothetical protein